MSTDKITSIGKMRKKKKHISMQEYARILTKTYLEPQLKDDSIKEPKGLASGDPSKIFNDNEDEQNGEN